MKRIGFLLLCMPGIAFADITGTGDAAILAQLQVQTAKIVDQLKTVSETLDVSKRMEEMEQLRFIRRISAEGEALKGIVSDVNEATGLINDQRTNAFNHQDVVDQIEYLESRSGNAEDVGDYANLMADLKRVRMLGQANRQTMVLASRGTDEQEDIKSTSTSTMIMADIMVEQEKRRAMLRAEEVNAMQQLFKSNGYSELYE